MIITEPSSFESFLVDTVDVVVVHLENTQIRKTGDGARSHAGNLVVGQVSAIENISDLKIIHLF